MAAAFRGAYQRLVDAYCSKLSSNPWTTQALTSAALWCVERRPHKTANAARHNRKRAAILFASRLACCLVPARRGAGDFVAQGVEHGAAPAAVRTAGTDCADDVDSCSGITSSTDVRRVALVTLYGGCFVGPLGHGWYEFLDRAARRVWPAGSPRCIAAKIAADTVIFGPIHVASALCCLAAAPGSFCA
jgi:hypothetical protein